jgi:hypothetical protein
MVMFSDCVLLGVAHRDRDLPQLGLSKSPVEPRSFALLVVLQDHSRRAASPFFLLEIDAWVVDGHPSAPRYTIFGLNRPTILAERWPHFDFGKPGL